MKEILDRLSIGVVVLTEEGNVSFVNSFCRERGIVSEEWEGRRYYEAFKSLELIGFTSDILGGDLRTLEFEHSGSIYRASPLGERAFQIEDVTELKRFEKLKREFTASLSHELSTPLTAVKGLLETALLQETSGKELLRKAMKRIEDLEKLISSLRFLVLLDSEQRYVEEKFPLMDLLKEILKDFEREIAQKNLDVVLSGREVEIESDRGKLYVLLKNLVENAIRYNREGGRISVRIEKGAPGTRVVIEDTGEGIPKEDIPLLFQPFFGSKNKKGMGLGLAISKRIADLLGAELRIESEEGKGTTAEVFLKHPHKANFLERSSTK